MQKRKEKRPLGLNARARLMAAAVIGCYAMSPAWAQLPVPVNATDRMFRWDGNQLIVTTGGDRVIIPWHSFSIGPGNIVHFTQPSATSAVLNRVSGPDPSFIYGTLSSNGRVWLINPNGITIGPGGMVNTAGFIASTLDVSKDNFLAGKLTFAKGDVARDVVNQGTITSPSGGS
ncbi:MAG TPA: filamentous hemagglutinin N-terminal domain-containing protein, partial [Rhodocyclaceae bacterium]